jgi:triphosphoribosyl-dephospho-CoA synthase
MPSDPAELSALTTLACLLEASAPKPGNVSPGKDFRDMHFADFLTSAVAVGPALGAAGGRALGETILAAIQATRQWTRANTNLGIVLLLAPLAKAAAVAEATTPAGLRRAVEGVLQASTVEDARLTYAAIGEADPSGLGTVDEQDVHEPPTVTLVEAMRLAADRDLVAREYVTDYALTFEEGHPALRAAREAGLGWEEAIVETFLTLLAAQPDSLIARKLGRHAAEAISFRASETLRLGGVRSTEGRSALVPFDADLRDPQNSRNPGTIADLTAAAVFVALIEDRAPDRLRMDRA